MAARAKTDRAPGAEGENEKQVPADPRGEALRRLQAQVADHHAENDPVYSYEGDPVAAGGGVKVGVVFDHYQLRVDGVWRSFVKGDVLEVSKDDADRGESLEGLKRL